jgi:CMP-N-acetylneuraminic acid synthetase
MPPERSVDIDTEVDFAVAEAMLEASEGPSDDE